MKILFMGSPDFCVQFLMDLAEEHEIVGIITKPDLSRNKRRSDRTNNPEWYALRNNVILLQPAKFNKATVSRIKHLKPDIIVVIAYGMKLPEDVLKIPGKGCINIHFSYLPEYRGSAPARWVLINGETETGVTAMYMDENIDTGNIIIRERVSIELTDKYEELMGKLVYKGQELLQETLKGIIRRDVKVLNQDGLVKYKYAPLIKKEDSRIDWKDSAKRIYNITRAFHPAGAWMEIQTGAGKKRILKIIEVSLPIQENSFEGRYKAGQIIEVKNEEGVAIKCGMGYLRLLEVQVESRNKCSAYDYLMGARLKQGDNIINGK